MSEWRKVFRQTTDIWIIYTYHGIDIEQYSAIKEYLTPFRETLEGRATDQLWYELQQPQRAYQQAFESSKIVYPELALHAAFSFDLSGSYPDSTVYCIPTQAKYLTALLNSSLLDFVLMNLSPAMRGNFHRYKKEYMRQVPIVEPNLAEQARLAALVDQLQALGGQGPKAVALEQEVDVIVYHMYGLSGEEIAEIEHWHAERRAQLSTGRRGQRIVAEEIEA